ncbi:MAG: response regulator [Verrucomicrobiales bacterium]|nr:response regulator [Verrucomicrobiales bacterium]
MISPQPLDFLEGIAAPIVATNLEGLIIYWSAEAEQALGFSPQEMKLRNWWEHFPAPVREQIKTAFATPSSGATFAGACVLRHRDGTIIPVVVHVAVMLAPDRSAQALLTMLHKIASASQGLASTPSEAAHKELEQTQEAVYQARKTQAIGALAAGLAHDFNNILTAILSHLDLLLLTPALPAELREHASYAKTSTVRAAELVSRLLSFSRQARPVLAPLQLPALVEEAIVLLRRKIEAKVELRPLAFAEDIWTVNADANHMMQLLTSLCLNGRDAMPDGGILSFKLANVAFSETEAVSPRRPGEFVRLTVSDTGKGVPPHLLERFFEHYFTTKEFGRGIGLGLAIVNSIVSEHGGWLEVESEAGAGSQFHAYLPRLRHARSKRETPREVLAANNQSLEGRETILLVDDEEMVRMVVRAVLGYRGYAIVEVTNGEEALQKLTDKPARFDLVLLDLNMPKMDGWETLRRLRQIQPTVPVIVLSGDSTEELAARITEAGAAVILQKPFDNLELLRQVRRMLDAARPRG